MNIANIPSAKARKKYTKFLKRTISPQNHVTVRITNHTMATAIMYIHKGLWFITAILYHFIF